MIDSNTSVKSRIIKNIICPVCQEIGAFRIRFFINRKTNLEVANPLFSVLHYGTGRHQKTVTHPITKYLRHLYGNSNSPNIK